jgi:carbon-monoxide dehydrogenase medium subunit
LYAHSPQEAVALMRQRAGKGCYIAGGTDLYLWPPADCDFVVDINDAGLGRIERTATGGLHLGATVSLQMLTRSPLVTGFAGGAVAQAAHHCGNRPVRTVATLGGNLCNALPSADMAPVLLALDAVAHIGDGSTSETLPLTDFFTGPRATILDDRLLLGVELPSRTAPWQATARKLTRTAEDISLVHVAVALGLTGTTVTEARIALGAVAPVPLRATQAEQTLVGLDCATADFTAEVDKAAELAAAATAPIDDHRASAEYRRAMVAVLTRRLVCELTHRGGDAGP